MAFITVEDLFGTVEVIIFPRDYEKYSRYLNEDEKVFVAGHANVEEEKTENRSVKKSIPLTTPNGSCGFSLRKKNHMKKRKKNCIPGSMVRTEMMRL